MGTDFFFVMVVQKDIFNCTLFLLLVFGVWILIPYCCQIILELFLPTSPDKRGWLLIDSTSILFLQ